jgi:hypothetical protein
MTQFISGPLAQTTYCGFMMVATFRLIRSRSVTRAPPWKLHCRTVSVVNDPLMSDASCSSKIALRKNPWIFLNNKKFLPVDYRPGSISLYDNTMVIGCPTGQMMFLEF